MPTSNLYLLERSHQTYEFVRFRNVITFHTLPNNLSGLHPPKLLRAHEMGGERDVTGEGRRGGRDRDAPADGRHPRGSYPSRHFRRRVRLRWCRSGNHPPMPRGMHQADGGRGKAGHGAEGGWAPHDPDRRQDPQGEGGESYLPHRDGMGNPPHGFWR